jgi:hypothetical protein
MQIPEGRSRQLADLLLSLSSSELAAMLRQLHPDDLAAAWAAMPPWACGLIWERYRRVRNGL